MLREYNAAGRRCTSGNNATPLLLAAADPTACGKKAFVPSAN
jgi:hypothetical protein